MEVTHLKIMASVTSGWSASPPSGVSRRLQRVGFQESPREVELVCPWELVWLEPGFCCPGYADPHLRSGFVGSSQLLFFFPLKKF